MESDSHKSSAAAPVTLAIVDDHNLFREALAALLKDNPRYKIVGEAADGRTALQMVAKMAPDILLLDLLLPGMPGLDLIRQVGKPTRVLAVSMRSDELYVAQALKQGAAGYLVKESSGDELLKAIETVLRNERYISPTLNQRKIDQLVASMLGHSDPYESLTMREQLVLQFAAEGLSSSEIGARLFISSRTVEFHRANIMKKLGLHSQTALIKFAIRQGITAP